jgi:hypothetical protein
MRDLSTAELARASDARPPAADSATDETPPAAPAVSAPVRPVESRGATALFPENETKDFRSRWADIQGTFVDEPRKAVEAADALVANLMKRLAETFATERANLEHQWDRGDSVTTEDLRLALQRYRSFFDRLLSF